MCSLCRLPVPKNYNFGQILTFWGSCTDPLLPMKAEFDVYSRPMVYAYVPNFVSIGLFCRTVSAKYAICCVFWTWAFSGVANWQQSEKVGHGCTTTNLPLSNGTKTVSVLQRLHGTISDVQKRDRQTNRQTERQNTLNVFGHPGGA